MSKEYQAPSGAEHPITPPPELVQQWIRERDGLEHLATQAARWGADQELEACCEWFIWDWSDIETADKLRTARRPKLPSLKEQALMALEDGDIGPGASLTPVEVCIICRALEQLDD